MAFSDWYWLLILIVEILVVTLVLYVSMRLICGRKKLDASYFFRLFFVSLLLCVGVTAVANALLLFTASFYAPMFYVFLTIGFIFIIRYLLTTPVVIPHQSHSADKYWQWSIWMTIISLAIIFLIIFLVDIISGGTIDLFPYF
ncbi:MAG: hypothetical protein KAS22_06730 [Candidatus Heimdallarchaeota archaeon]|nr:hypothetical protein [Candidatus Heimdallarchaeota archaeon]MCK5183483.1 hypothetical protein [Candidatus Heimdallarchaeota archaeon]